MKKLISLVFISLIIFTNGAQSKDTPSQNIPSRACFIENKGQWESDILYMAKLSGMNAWITKSGVVYDYYKINKKSDSSDLLEKHDLMKFSKFEKLKYARQNLSKDGHALKMTYSNSEPNIQKSYGIDKRETYYNYFIGKDSSKWASFVPLYNEIIIENIYQGISIRYYFEEADGKSSLRYDYIISPNADLSQIKMDYQGQNKLSIKESGELSLQTSLGEVLHQNLYAYQENEYHEKQKVQCAFIQNFDGSIAFNIGAYNKNSTLVIDPLAYSTFIGGTGDEECSSIALDSIEECLFTWNDFIPILFQLL